MLILKWDIYINSLSPSPGFREHSKRGGKVNLRAKDGKGCHEILSSGQGIHVYHTHELMIVVFICIKLSLPNNPNLHPHTLLNSYWQLIAAGRREIILFGRNGSYSFPCFSGWTQTLANRHQ